MSAIAAVDDPNSCISLLLGLEDIVVDCPSLFYPRKGPVFPFWKAVVCLLTVLSGWPPDLSHHAWCIGGTPAFPSVRAMFQNKVMSYIGNED